MRESRTSGSVGGAGQGYGPGQPYPDPDPGPEPFDLDRALAGIPEGGLIDREWFWANQHRFKWKLAPPTRRRAR